MKSSTLSAIEAALTNERYETARRLCRAELATELPPLERQSVLLHLHEAYRKLAEWSECLQCLSAVHPVTLDDRLTLTLLLAEHHAELSRFEHYRLSQEAKEGFTSDEYEAKYQTIATTHFATAERLADTAERKRRVAASLGRSNRPGEAQRILQPLPAEAPVTSSPPAGTGSLVGRITMPDGRPVADAQVTLGLAVDVRQADPATYLVPEMHYTPVIGEQQALATRTDSQGCYCFPSVPAGDHAFLAVTLDPDRLEIPTRFVAHQVCIRAGEEALLDGAIEDWASAPAETFDDPYPAELQWNGHRYRKCGRQVLNNPFYYPFPRQLVGFPVPSGASDPAGVLVLTSLNGSEPVSLPFQVSDSQLHVFTDLPACSTRQIGIYIPLDGSPSAPGDVSRLLPQPEADGGTAVIDTGPSQIRIPWGEGSDLLPPLLQVRGRDKIWRGHGRLTLPVGVGVARRTTNIMESGALLLVLEVAYALTTGQRYTVRITAHQDEPYVLVHELSEAVEGARFEFSLREFGGGRGYLHWCGGHGVLHWSSLTPERRELARLQESVPWWVPPAGFGYGMTADGLDHQDFIGVFTLRRGEWVDRAFEAICRGPGDEPAWRRELDWPFPEMVGSTISMITAHTDEGGDAFFRFNLFEGERHWGILISTLDRNDGPVREISLVQHKNSSPRLDEFQHWRLDAQDHLQRPHVVARREDLPRLRRQRTSPAFSTAWKNIESGTAIGAADGLRFAVTGDPLVAWRKKLELVGVAHIRSAMTLWGRDYSDMYSPVGARPITHWAEEFDLIAASGVFTAEEERTVRRFLMLMGHLYMSPDFMNWKFGSRNANFEADRTDVVGAIGLTFHGNPDARQMLDHVTELMERSLNTYCTPGSGRWYENPACYYLHASKCRMNLVFHLARHGIYDATDLPRLKEYLLWGVRLLTPPAPQDDAIMRDGTTLAGYDEAKKVRRIAPVGDHAHLGPWLPEHYALAARIYRPTDPDFADALMWAYQSGGADGRYFGNLPLFFAALDEKDLRPVDRPDGPLVSRRLEGFGSVFRGDVGSPREFFLLTKQGPGGYRYHRSEGSIILFDEGRPLIYDGGEAGETWRHSTLSFGPTHLPLAPGHVERFHILPSLEFSQGVHPTIIRPGEPIQFNDRCSHDLVPVALQRFAEPHPANSRTLIWIKGEYIILHDELDVRDAVSSHWHLQPVADGYEGNWQDGYRFNGRFGVDLQVLLPGQRFDRERVERLPTLEYHVKPEQCFATHHLSLSNDRVPSHYLAVLRPLGGNRQAVEAHAVKAAGKPIGVRVTGDTIDDLVLLSRSHFEYETEEATFSGRYASILQRGAMRHLALLDGELLRTRDVKVRSTGPVVHITTDGRTAEVTAEGTGDIEVIVYGQQLRRHLQGGRTIFALAGGQCCAPETGSGPRQVAAGAVQTDATRSRT